jgi:hypothetical protein
MACHSFVNLAQPAVDFSLLVICVQKVALTFHFTTHIRIAVVKQGQSLELDQDQKHGLVIFNSKHNPMDHSSQT